MTRSVLWCVIGGVRSLGTRRSDGSAGVRADGRTDSVLCSPAVVVGLWAPAERRERPSPFLFHSEGLIFKDKAGVL